MSSTTDKPFVTPVTGGGGVSPDASPGLKSERGRPGPALKALMRWHEPTALLGDQPGTASPVTGATWKTTLGVTTAAGIKTVMGAVLANIKTDLGLTPR